MGAEVLVQATPLRALTGDDGRFQVSVPDDGAYTLVVIADGYGSAEVTAEPARTADDALRIALEPLLFDVPGVTVTASRTTVRPGQAPVSVAIPERGGAPAPRRHQPQGSAPVRPGCDLQRGPDGHSRLQRHRSRGRQPGADVAGRPPGAHRGGVGHRLQHPAPPGRRPRRDRQGPQLHAVGHERHGRRRQRDHPPAPGAPAHRRARLLRRVRHPGQPGLHRRAPEHARPPDPAFAADRGRGRHGVRRARGIRWISPERRPGALAVARQGRLRGRVVKTARGVRHRKTRGPGGVLHLAFPGAPPRGGSRGPGRLEAHLRSRLRDDGHARRDLHAQAAVAAPGAARPQPQLFPRQPGLSPLHALRHRRAALVLLRRTARGHGGRRGLSNRCGVELPQPDAERHRSGALRSG